MTNIVVPELGESVVEARIARWLKKAGDRVEIGEPVVELETEKIDLEVNAEKPGIITTIARKEGDDVKIGELLAVIDESASTPVAPPAPATGNGAKQPTAAPPSEARIAQSSEVRPAPTRDSSIAPTREAPIAPPREGKIAPTSDRPIARTSVSSIAPTSVSSIGPTRSAAYAPAAACRSCAGAVRRRARRMRSPSM